MKNLNMNNTKKSADDRTIEQELSGLRETIALLNDENSELIKEKKKNEENISFMKEDIEELTQERDTAKSDYEELVKIAERDKKLLVRERRKLKITMTVIAIEFVLILISMLL